MDNSSVTEKYTDALYRIKLHSMECILQNADKAIYHDIRYGQRLAKHIEAIAAEEGISIEDTRLLRMCGWLYTCVLTNSSSSSKVREERDAESIAYIDNTLLDEIKHLGISDTTLNDVIPLLRNSFQMEQEQNQLGEVFADAVVMDFVEENSLSRLKKFYEEAILSDVNLSLEKFYEILSRHLSEYKGFTNYGKEKVLPGVISILQKIERENRKLSRKKSVLLKKELEITEEELKELRKNLISVKGRDVRGVQTLFRTTSRNHYTLNEMVDRKANIMITVNAIILSVVIGGFLGQTATDSLFSVLPLVILSLSSLFSIIFAVLSITPNRTQGQFTKEEILNKEGNLLYFGNFHNMKFRDYEWGMLEKLNDSNFLYSSMIKDLYYLGKSLHRKYTFIRISLQFFVIGLVSSFIIFMIGRMVFFY